MTCTKTGKCTECQSQTIPVDANRYGKWLECIMAINSNYTQCMGTTDTDATAVVGWCDLVGKARLKSYDALCSAKSYDALCSACDGME